MAGDMAAISMISSWSSPGRSKNGKVPTGPVSSVLDSGVGLPS